MIHACPDRMWYVEQFLVPSILRHGIPPDDIIVWNDGDGKGNLESCMASFRSCKGIPGGTWHLQDDVLICHDFAERTREFGGDMITCGFCYTGYENGTPIPGYVFPVLMWNSSFPCIYIPNRIAAECADWFYNDARHRPEFAGWVASGKMDDNFFHAFVVERHPNELVLNLAPHLVEHVDYIIGGSTINSWRHHTTRGYWFEDDYLTEELKTKVKQARR